MENTHSADPEDGGLNKRQRIGETGTSSTNTDALSAISAMASMSAMEPNPSGGTGAGAAAGSTSAISSILSSNSLSLPLPLVLSSTADPNNSNNSNSNAGVDLAGEKASGEDETRDYEMGKGGDMSPKQLAKQRKREKDRVRAHQKRVQYREQSNELKRLREQVNAGIFLYD
jgi:hypothetical protein